MRRGSGPRPVLSLAAACAVLAAIVAAGQLTPPVSPEAEPGAKARQVLVKRASAVCPELRSDAATNSRVGLAAPGLLGSADARSAEAQGRAELRGLEPDSRSRLTLTQPSAASLTLPASVPPAGSGVPDGAMVGIGRGDLAPGFGASFVTRTTRGELRGLAGAACAAEDTDFWFVGSGAVIGQRGRLYLTNSTSSPALLDVSLFGTAGPLEVVAARGLTVAAHAQEVRPLDAWAPTTSRFGIHVRVRQGRIAAAVRDHQVRGLDPRGIDWLPAAAAPSSRVVIPGVPGGEGARLLQVVVPGDTDAIVRVRLLAADGSFVPAAADVLEVSAGTVFELDLAPQLAGKDMAVELTSDVPVTAGLLARTGAAPGELEDLAYTAAARALTADDPGLVPQTSGGALTKAHITLAAPRGEATVRVAPLSSVKGSGKLVTVADGAQVTVELERSATTEPDAVVIEPQSGSGPVYAAVVIEEVGRFGRLLTVIPVTPGRYAVEMPAAVADMSAGLGPARCTAGC
jgi:hypothetical protein